MMGLRPDDPWSSLGPDLSHEDIAELAHLPQELGELFSFFCEGVFYFRGDLVEIRPGDEAVFFQQLESVGKDGIADVLEVVFDEFEAVVAFLDTK